MRASPDVFLDAMRLHPIAVDVVVMLAFGVTISRARHLALQQTGLGAHPPLSARIRPIDALITIPQVIPPHR